MRVLFLTHRVPYPPNRGDRLRAFHILRTLTTAAEVELVSLAHDSQELAQADALQRLMQIPVTALRTTPIRNYMRAGAALLGTRPLTHCLLDATGFTTVLRGIVDARPPDVVLAYCSGMARFALDDPLRQFPTVIDFLDVDSAKWAALATTTAWPKGWIYRREARCLGRFEAAAARRVVSVVINERERATLASMAPSSDIHVIGVGVDLDGLRPPGPPIEAPQVVFCGVMDYEPNVQGLLWFVRDVWPLVRARRPDALVTIVGSHPTKAIRRLASDDHGIEITGTVPDVREYLWRSAISIAPLLTARGVQNKVLEALAAGLPTVVTTAVMKGLPTEVHTACRVADSRQAFADEILELLMMSGSERRAVAARARLDSMSWEAQLSPLSDLLRQASRHPGSR